MRIRRIRMTCARTAAAVALVAIAVSGCTAEKADHASGTNGSAISAADTESDAAQEAPTKLDQPPERVMGQIRAAATAPASWDAEPPVVQASQVGRPYQPVIGILFTHFSSMKSKGAYEQCTATAVAGANQSTVWTSAHCISEGQAGKFAYGVFVPGYNNEGKASPQVNPWDPDSIAPHAPYGVFKVASSWVPKGWKTNYDGKGKINDKLAGVDYGAVVVHPNSKGQTLTQALGGKAAQLSFDPTLDDVRKGVTVIGYPGAEPYNGTTQYKCAQAPQVLPEPGNPGKEFRVGCTMTPGCSGGPWIATVDDRVAIIGTSSFGPSKSTWLTSTMLSDGAKALYTKASSASH